PLVVGVADGGGQVGAAGGGAVVGAGELQWPVLGQVQQGVFVVAGGGQVVHGRGGAVKDLVPLFPLFLAVGVVDQVAGVHGQVCVGFGVKGGLDDGAGAFGDVGL